MWKKYKKFLRKRTDRQLLISIIIAILSMFFSIKLAVNDVFGVIIYIVIILISCFVMVTFWLEAGRRDAESRKKLEKHVKN